MIRTSFSGSSCASVAKKRPSAIYFSGSTVNDDRRFWTYETDIRSPDLPSLLKLSFSVLNRMNNLSKLHI